MPDIMTATPAKFTFDLDMSHRREKSRVVTNDKLAALLEEARQEGYAQGHAEGQKSELARVQQALLAATEKLAQQTVNLTASVNEIHKANLGEAVQLGKAVGGKLATHLVAREPLAELEALITECLASLEHAPHLVIRCHPDLADAIRETAERRIAASGFTGRLMIMGEPEIALGDGRIEWVDGGLVRDSGTISEQIDKSIASYLSANGVTVAEETEQ